jgi:cathepsin L
MSKKSMHTMKNSMKAKKATLEMSINFLICSMKRNLTTRVYWTKKKAQHKRNLAQYTFVDNAGNRISNFYVFTANATELASTPASIDWTTKGFTKAVQDQGQCGSCYAFAGAAVVDGGLKIQKNITFASSQQEVVDCTTAMGNMGCNGGFIETSLEQAILKGMTDEVTYPYTKAAGACQTAKLVNMKKLTGFVQVNPNDEKSVAAAIAKYGPCVTSLDVENGLFSYTKGIYNGVTAGVSECPATNPPNHAVVIVGYGTENGVDFWKIRNSWGPTWGEAGHFRIVRNKANTCQIAGEVYCPIA